MTEPNERQNLSIIDFFTGNNLPEVLKPIELSALRSPFKNGNRLFNQAAFEPLLGHEPRRIGSPITKRASLAKVKHIAKSKAQFDCDGDDEEKFGIAANALLLARSFFLIRLHELPKDLRQTYSHADRKDYSGFYLFRERMIFMELIDDRIASPFDDTRDFPWQNSDLKTLILSNADIAQISLNDVPFSKDDMGNLGRAAGQLTRTDLKRPICQWEPGLVIEELRTIVLRYLEGYYGLPVKTDWRGQSGIRSGGEIGSEEYMAKCLTEIRLDNPKKKAKRETVLAILRSKFNFGGKASVRIWDRVEKAHWSKSGQIAEGMEIEGGRLIEMISEKYSI